MKFFTKLTPLVALRAGLGLMYIYSGYDLFMYPQHWYGFLPSWLSRLAYQIGSVDAYLKFQGAGECLMGVIFLMWFIKGKTLAVTAVLATLEMGLILIWVGIDPITFRDIGLLGASVAVLIMSSENNAEKQWSV